MNKNRNDIDYSLLHTESPMVKWCEQVDGYWRILCFGLTVIWVIIYGWSAIAPVVGTLVLYVFGCLLIHMFVPDSVIADHLEDQKETAKELKDKKTFDHLSDVFLKSVDTLANEDSSDFMKTNALEKIRECSKKLSDLKGLDEVPTLHSIRLSTTLVRSKITDKDGDIEFEFPDGVLCIDDTNGEFVVYNYNEAKLDDVDWDTADFVRHNVPVTAYEGGQPVDQFIEEVVFFREEKQ